MAALRTREAAGKAAEGDPQTLGKGLAHRRHIKLAPSRAPFILPGGGHRGGVPRGPLPLSTAVRPAERRVAVVEPEILFTLAHVLSTDESVHAVELLGANEQLATGEQGHHLAFPTQATQAAMDVLVLDQRAYLTVYHAVELGDEHDLIAVVTVLGKELDPLHAVLLTPLAAVEKKLGFVNDQEDIVLLDGLAVPVGHGEVIKVLRREVVVVDIGEPIIALGVLVDRKIAHHGKLLVTQGLNDQLRGMQALAGAGSAGIEVYGHGQSPNPAQCNRAL